MWNEWPALGPISTLKDPPSEMPNDSQSHSLSLTHPEVQCIAGGGGGSLVGCFLQLQTITFIKLKHRKQWICNQNKNWKRLSLLPVPMLYDIPVAGLNQQGFYPYRREGNVIPADMWHYIVLHVVFQLLPITEFKQVIFINPGRTLIFCWILDILKLIVSSGHDSVRVISTSVSTWLKFLHMS